MLDGLQYGALGLLAIVLVAISVGAREALRRDADRAVKREERQAAKAEDQDTFMQALNRADREDRRQYVETLEGLVRQSIEADHRVAGKLEGLYNGQAFHEAQAQKRHEALCKTVGGAGQSDAAGGSSG